MINDEWSFAELGRPLQTFVTSIKGWVRRLDWTQQASGITRRSCNECVIHTAGIAGFECYLISSAGRSLIQGCVCPSWEKHLEHFITWNGYGMHTTNMSHVENQKPKQDPPWWDHWFWGGFGYLNRPVIKHRETF